MKYWMAPSGLHVSPGEIADATEMARLHASAFFRGWSVEEFESYLEDASTTPIYVARNAKNQMAGFAVLRVVDEEAELLTIVVSPKWRKKGVGNALMQAVFADLQTTRASKLFLEVDNQNTAALNLYQRLGFAHIGERKGYYPHPDGSAATALVMRRELR